MRSSHFWHAPQWRPPTGVMHVRESSRGRWPVLADEIDLCTSPIGREDGNFVGEAAAEGGAEDLEELRRGVGKGVATQRTDGDRAYIARAAPYGCQADQDDVPARHEHGVVRVAGLRHVDARHRPVVAVYLSHGGGQLDQGPHVRAVERGHEPLDSPPLLVFPCQPRSHVDRPDLGITGHVGQEDATVESPAGQDGQFAQAYFSPSAYLPPAGKRLLAARATRA